ncbi:ATP-binding protein [Nocardia farcinica]|uniref:Putative DNA helicase n=1 Tax=Nocardia farcinica TaxID=37329 RepID=A0A449H7T0_NOCFR|nr:AAA domain-containing protein [Nocardia farcinica]MBF6361129.1 ATP-binding protein [Nocardia farcinica]PFX02167.1 tRNA(Met) cytidine acetyltransferase TmcA [Nocardia farcinica]PFX08202.1 tRNA(Met) cytidine acetyltransferase TmcA [Nocardia farcinica]VFA94055.1 putative DNA helicase [Nocardia farcinica]
MTTDHYTDLDAPTAAARATEQILADLAAPDHKAVVVDSPPGAGKSTLVVRAAGHLVDGGERPIIVAQTNNQVDDLIVRLAAEHPETPIGRLSSGKYIPTPAVLANSTVATKLGDMTACRIIVGTSAKWATVRDGQFGWAILDEAYQMRSDMLLQIVERFDRGLFVGDPGQLDPFTIVGTERWIGLPHDPTQNGVTVMLEHNKDTPVHRLPVSWRLPTTAAPTISHAFYPFDPFRAGIDDGIRSLEFRTTGFGKIDLDETLAMAFTTGWALHELPRRHVPRTDNETIQAAANLASRILDRGAIATCERHRDGRPIQAADIAIGVAHRDQADLVRTALTRTSNQNAQHVAVNTANRLQGREFEVVIVVHPLSGRRDATAFHLEAGRLCVLTSRHRQACIVVAREGITDLLDSHPSTDPVHLWVPAKFPDGWEANQVVMAKLAQHQVKADVSYGRRL